MLYQLTITDLEVSNDTYRESFSIGFFRSRKEAEEVADFYLAHVKGFCDHPCSFEITKRDISGQQVGESGEVFIVVGWNLNEDLDEVDIVESPCLVSESQASAVLAQMKAQHHRTEWAVQRWTVGRTYWGEGFVRYTY
ncbi:MAG: hypothetical protein IJ112_04615 [Oscillospiraceae bacterium]|nr:hypothetical protein [Oscillospiraceae bacterium]